MTRLGLIADIHGNIAALDAVISAAGPVDGWICAGDIAGHLPDVDEVVTRLREIGAHCVKGNHDAALIDGFGIPDSSAATRALQIQRRRISEETRGWLAALPEILDLTYDGIPVRVMHGGPRDPLRQKLTVVDDDVRACAHGRVLIAGHTHRALTDVADSYAVLNPGAVGLPVDGKCVARAMVLDLPSRSVREIANSYDISAVCQRLCDLGYDERYANCLREGRWVGFTGIAPKNRIIIAGASIYGEMLAELVLASGENALVGFVDDDPNKAGSSILGASVLGTLDGLERIAFENCVTDVALGIGDNSARMKVADIVKRKGVRLARLVHPRATVSRTAVMHQGVIVDANAYVGPLCELAEGVSIWPGAVISHHTRLGDYASVKPGAVIGGHTVVEAAVKIELGSVIPSYSKIT